MAISDKLVHGEKLTKETFNVPPVDMSILPFWFWNGEMDEEEMLYQMKEYKAKGIPGLFIHGRFGEKIGYLSETWFERVRFAVEKAKEIGLQIWIYDEMNWPSGTAERKVISRFPHLSQKYLELVALNIDGPLFTFLEATDSRYVNTGDSKPICAFACTNEEFKTVIKKLIDLTPNLSFNKVIPWEAPEGKWRLLYFLEKEVPYYIDALNPESTERFIEITHEGYKKAVGKDFGGIVPGFYTDEPAMHYYQVGVDNYVIPWSSEMFRIFRERRGYNLRPYLPALYLNMGEITAKIRYDFWRSLSEQYTDTYYKKIRQWCDENGVIFTGHLLFEEWLRLQARCEGNIFHHLRQMHITGVDHLYPKIGTEKEPDQHVALKLASSAAHHFGSTRLLCESMGGAYWDCTLERMKWIANWEYALGVNLFNNHGYHYSIEGERKRDWPPSQFYHHTWWKFYNHFTTYMARLGHSLSGGKHIAKVLVLFPLSSIWTNYTPQKRNPIAKIIEDEFYFLTDTLLRLHYDYDYVDEDVLLEAKLRDGKINIKDEEYELLILPPITHMKEKTFEIVKKFSSQGGKILCNTLIPFELLSDTVPIEPIKKDTAPRDSKLSKKDGNSRKNGQSVPGEILKYQKQLKEFFGADPMEILQAIKAQSTKNHSAKSYKWNKNISFISSKGKSKERRKEELKAALNKLLIPDCEISHEDVFYLHRLKDGYHIYFIVNTSKEDIRNVSISFEQSSLLPELWNADTGETEKVNVFDVKDSRIYLTLSFAPSESHFVIFKEKFSSTRSYKDLIIGSNLHIESYEKGLIKGYPEDNKSDIPYIKLKSESGQKTIKLKGQKILSPIRLGKQFSFKTEGENALLLSHWKMKVDENIEAIDKEYTSIAFDDSNWLNVTNGAWEMMLPVERTKEIYPVTLWYRTIFIMDFIPEDKVDLLIDGFSSKSYKLYINGSEMDLSKAVRSSLDAEIKKIDIKDFLTIGANLVTIKLIVQRRTDGILDLLKIAGNFALEKSNDERSNGQNFDVYKIVKPIEKISIGDWTENGYPYFSGTGIYETEFEIKDESYLMGKMFLNTDCGEDVLEVIVNNSEARVIPWHPYRLDINSLLRKGNNKITLKVTNTLINMLEGVKKPSGIFKEPLITFHPQYQIDINNYKAIRPSDGKANKKGNKWKKVKI
ncbi:MAG: glycosyl hydrolase [Bacteroidota bacterium]|nr:glycosyl hydrolase [Bacteroidota bacterium]